MLDFDATDDIEINETDDDVPLILGETPPLSLQFPGASDLASNEMIPERTLTDFVIFDPETGKHVNLDDVDKGGLQNLPVGQGTVNARFAHTGDESGNERGGDEDEDEDGDRDAHRSTKINLSTILRVWADQHAGIWVQTQYAWYLLDSPQDEYRPVYQKYFIRQMLVCAICEIISVDAPSQLRQIISVQDLVRSFNIAERIPSDLSYEVQRILGRTLNETDLKKNVCHF